jgi:hypothetical protein
VATLDVGRVPAVREEVLDDTACLVDVRPSRSPHDRRGRAHPDALTFVATLATVVTGRPPTPGGSSSKGWTWFTFAGAQQGPVGVGRGLVDGRDGMPLTRGRLDASLRGTTGDPAGSAARPAYVGRRYGFTVRAAGLPGGELRPQQVTAANLATPDRPRHPRTGALMRVGTDEVLVDPETARFRLHPAALGVDPQTMSTDHLLACTSSAEEVGRALGELRRLAPAAVPAGVLPVVVVLGEPAAGPPDRGAVA